MSTASWDRAFLRAASAWPAVRMARERFEQHARARAPSEPELAALLESRFLPDMYLAWACLDGNADAAAALEEHCKATVHASVRRTQLAPERIPEVEQRLRVQLLVAEGGRDPALANYAGRGSLRAWVGVVAARLSMRLMGSAHREVAVANDVIERLFGPTADPELEHLKDVYREEFGQAFKKALAALEPRQRTLLKQRYLDGVEVNQLARLYKTHRATVSRWLSDAKDALASRTHVCLAQQLAISESECESVLRLIESQMDVTLSRFASEP